MCVNVCVNVVCECVFMSGDEKLAERVREREGARNMHVVSKQEMCRSVRGVCLWVGSTDGMWWWWDNYKGEEINCP